MADVSSFPITSRWPPKHPDRLQLYSLNTPNGVKASIMLEEIGLPYEPHLADIALLGWVRNLVVFYEAAHLVEYDSFANVHRWLDAGLARPAVQRGLRSRRGLDRQAKLKLMLSRSPRPVPGSTSWRRKLSHISRSPARGSTVANG